MQPNACATISLERYSLDLYAREKSQIASAQRRDKEAVHNTKTLTVLGIKVYIASPVSNGRSNVIENLVARFLASSEKACC